MTTPTPEPVSKKYKSRSGAMCFIRKNGKPCNFVEGEYITDDTGDIADLDLEIKTGHPTIYVDENDATGVSPSAKLEGLRASIREEERLKLLADQQSAAKINTDAQPAIIDVIVADSIPGAAETPAVTTAEPITTLTSKLDGIGSSVTLGAGAVDSNSVQ